MLRQLRRRGRPQAEHPECFCQGHEIRILQIAAVIVPVELHFLGAAHIAESAVIEHDRNAVDAVQCGSGHLGHGEHESAIATDRDHRPVGMRHLHAERSRVSVSQRILEPRVDDAARMVGGKSVPAVETNLRDVGHHDAFVGQAGAYGIGPGFLRFQNGDLFQCSRFDRFQFRLTRGARLLGQCGPDCSERPGRTGNESQISAGRLLRLHGVDLDAYGLHALVRTPRVAFHVARAHREHHIDLRPQQIAAHEGLRKVMAIRHRAARVARHHDRRLQRLGKCEQFLLRAECAAAGNDQGLLRAGEPLRGLLHRLLVRNRIRNARAASPH